MSSHVILNFHGIGAPARPLEPDEADYWISRSAFVDFLNVAAPTGAEPPVEITFDDGNASDIHIAAPELARRGLSATFFILAGRLDKPGSLSRAQIADLARQGMRIGTHGFDHVDWRALDDSGIRRELIDARDAIQDAARTRIVEAAIPFGDYNRRVLSLLRAAGYQRVHTCDGGRCAPDAWLCPRTSARSFMTTEDVRSIVNGLQTPLRTLRRELAKARKRLLSL